MSQKKEKYNRHMMRQYEGIATDVDILYIRTDIMERELQLERDRWDSMDKGLPRSRGQMHSLTRNQRKEQHIRHGVVVGITVLLLITSALLWYLGTPKENETPYIEERIPVTELWTVPVTRVMDKPLHAI